MPNPQRGTKNALQESEIVLSGLKTLHRKAFRLHYVYMAFESVDPDISWIRRRLDMLNSVQASWGLSRSEAVEYTRLCHLENLYLGIESHRSEAEAKVH